MRVLQKVDTVQVAKEHSFQWHLMHLFRGFSLEGDSKKYPTHIACHGPDVLILDIQKQWAVDTP